ncbi:peptidase T [Caldithrix abyssi DSM 13497]|uniref:Peptidase T n=1 Tax=Caldithrix abyssi DSM 13497 TaxID=880073 RepID=H1XQE6_CALAY|nr:peptidase T [Caldithrix abyssi]APF19942.1 peptidase T, Metallo peptidase, MEROPS family M20B [Caldithrix abyssi DSM 13497]EHO40033.1 peptidase T [Caldithrix abyssi DSM 13497]
MKPIERRLFLDRFLNYVKFDTQSSEESETYPSTEKQKELGRYLVKELTEMGLQDVEMDEHGYVFATLPANVDYPVPTIGLIAHMDTSPEVSGANVKPIIHENYQGGDIVLPGDPEQVLKPETDKALKECIGQDIITSDGTTLLGADNKAGIAEIMGALQYLIENPDIKHGKIRVAFTVDEEVGTGTKYFDVKKFGADYAYTIDGESAGEIEDETFCADTAKITIKGVNVHPGYAKGKLINGIKIAAEIIERLPKDSMSPETTEGREGYLHPHAIKGGVELTEIIFLVRDFTVEGLKEKEEFLQKLCDEMNKKYAPASATLTVEESYRNMKYKIDEDPKVVEYAIEAVKRAGLQPKQGLIRGGTDGARLSYMGLLTPNVFTGGHNFHSKKEWICIRDMEKAVETIVHLANIWAEKSK